MAEEALKLKEQGNAEYKKKNFDEAIELYTKAFGKDGTNLSCITNRAAAHFEKKDYSACREDCLKAVDLGRENRADFKMIAKAFSRVASSYAKEGDFKNAVLYYDKSLAEHRTPETLKKRQEVEKKLKELDRLAYVDPEKSEEEKALGNAAFQKGDYPTARKHYTEAIKRNPDNCKIYSNRAACYTKLAEFRLGLDDCEMCIKLDPTFVKGYLRKGTILMGLHDYSKASIAFKQALELDSNNKEARDGVYKCSTYSMPTEGMSEEDIKKRAMANPRVQKIMEDPAMRMILEQMHSNPGAVKEHLQNPEIAANIQTLMEAGLIRLQSGPSF
ncbi:stress-induced-phosphoprotein 1 [Strongylocentrotus purpuratus]|uniref:Stress-induced-phosphoprotein 1 n=1 Tax=Strongylocentrotus purpuratus TaxID=7668 RepID=A0A7M7PRQ7_STRPU|nr:stress-induced-phosphoprotein 1 [Strongylocentrotus purpuratus]